MVHLTEDVGNVLKMMISVFLLAGRDVHDTLIDIEKDYVQYNPVLNWKHMSNHIFIYVAVYTEDH